MFWSFENRGRLLREKSEIESLAGEVPWIRTLKWGLHKDLKLKVDVDIIVGDITYEVELVYPDLFPDTPVYIRPRSPTEALWSSHQYIDGALCLEWGPDNWNSEITGAVLLQSAYKLLASEGSASTARQSVPSRHDVTFGQEVRSNPWRLVITDALGTLLKDLPSDTYYNLVTHHILHRTANVLFISELEVPEVNHFLSMTYRPVLQTISQYFP
jgi:hypothetical protein